MMNRIRPKKKLSPSFEALEGRLALSTGVEVITHPAHVLVKSPAHRQVPFSFKGHVSVSGSTVTITKLTGTIGRDHFTGSGTGKTSGTIFQGGYVYLNNSKGRVTLQLSPATVTQVGKRTRQSVAVVAVESSGKYDPYTGNGNTGTLTTWNIPVQLKATATFSGVLHLT